MFIKEETDLAYRMAIDTLTRVQIHPLSTPEQVKKAEHAIDELNLAQLDEVLGNFEERTAILNGMVQTLNRIPSSIELDPTSGIMDRLRKIIEKGRDLLLQASNEAMPGDESPSDPDAVESDNQAIAAPPPDKADMKEDEKFDDPPPLRPGLPVVPPVTIGTQVSKVPGKLKADYEKLFATCAIRPDKNAKINWHVKKLEERKGEYKSVGNELKVPWWFIGAIHAMETGFRFDRHLHNGDPLSKRTTRVPPGRPAVGAPPFSWKESARDAITYMKFDKWDDWSIAGVLYKWECYNGFGYRKYHPEVLSPYLWSYTNHYTKGKYVSDGKFNANAVSKQCGTAGILRMIVNKGIAVF